MGQYKALNTQFQYCDVFNESDEDTTLGQNERSIWRICLGEGEEEDTERRDREATTEDLRDRKHQLGVRIFPFVNLRIHEVMSSGQHKPANIDVSRTPHV